MADTLLNLSTLTERPVVVIDGAPYDMRARAEVSLLELHRLRRQGERIEALMAAPTLTEEGTAEVAAILDTLCRSILVGVPDAVHATLQDMHRLAIVRAFTTLLEPTPPAQERASTATPASTSPASSASTAATQ